MIRRRDQQDAGCISGREVDKDLGGFTSNLASEWEVPSWASWKVGDLLEKTCSAAAWSFFRAEVFLLGQGQLADLDGVGRTEMV